MKVEFSLKGIPEVEKALLELGKKPAKKLMVQGMRAGMKQVKEAVHVPVVSGQMARAVKVRVLPRSRTSFGVGVQIGEKDFQGKTYYAAMVEFGSSKQPAQGNLRKAFDETHDKAIKTFEDFMRAGLGL